MSKKVKKNQDYAIGIPIYEGVDLLDVIGPLEVFYRMQFLWNPNLKVLLVADHNPVTTESGVQVIPQTTFDACPRLDLLFVPGANNTSPMMGDKAQQFLKDKARHAQYVTSVCTGALILAEAGLLDGFRATTHWMAISDLKKYPNVEVVNGCPRYVVDRNRITGGGISSGLDEALVIATHVAGEEVARQIQLMIQYHPQPPYNDGDPCVADPSIYASLCKKMGGCN